MPSIEWKVKDVQVVRHLSILVTFEDRTQGEVTIDPKWLTGIFTELKDESKFNAVSVVHGAVTWACGLDLDPLSMYEDIKNNGYHHIQ